MVGESRNAYWGVIDNFEYFGAAYCVYLVMRARGKYTPVIQLNVSHPAAHPLSHPASPSPLLPLCVYLRKPIDGPLRADDVALYLLS